MSDKLDIKNKAIITFSEYDNILKRYATYIGIEYSKENKNRIIIEGLKLLTNVYKPNANNISIKNLAIFIDTKHRIINKISNNDELFADVLIIYFAQILIKYDRTLYKFYGNNYIF